MEGVSSSSLRNAACFSLRAARLRSCERSHRIARVAVPASAAAPGAPWSRPATDSTARRASPLSSLGAARTLSQRSWVFCDKTLNNLQQVRIRSITGHGVIMHTNTYTQKKPEQCELAHWCFPNT
jgi:hypothetical protein